MFLPRALTFGGQSDEKFAGYSWVKMGDKIVEMKCVMEIVFYLKLMTNVSKEKIGKKDKKRKNYTIYTEILIFKYKFLF